MNLPNDTDNLHRPSVLHMYILSKESLIFSAIIEELSRFETNLYFKTGISPFIFVYF